MVIHYVPTSAERFYRLRTQALIFMTNFSMHTYICGLIMCAGFYHHFNLFAVLQETVEKVVTAMASIHEEAMFSAPHSGESIPLSPSINLNINYRSIE